MTKVEPFVSCTDYWPCRIPDDKLLAYKAMIDEGQIRQQHVIHNRTTGATLVQYVSNQPHEWILQELKRRSEAL